MQTLRRSPIEALLLSFITPGLGQVYNTQLGKAAIMYFSGLSLTTIFSIAGLFYRFNGMIFYLAVLIGFFLLVLLDALFSAVRLREVELKPYNKWYLYILIFLLHVFVIAPVIRYNLIPLKAYKMPTGAMEPTLIIADRFIVQMNYYENKMPQRGDIVVFPFPRDPLIKYAKRVVGLEGEKIEIKDKKVFINRREIQEPWVVHKDTTIIPKDTSPRDNFDPVTVPKGFVFVMGDNRDYSLDSRFYGFIDIGQIKGKALYVYWAKDRKRIGFEFE